MASGNDLLLAGLCTGTLRLRAPFEQAAEESTPFVAAQAVAEPISQLPRQLRGDGMIIEPVATGNGT